MFTDEALCEMRMKWGGSGVMLNHGGREGKLPQLYTDAAVLLTKLEEELYRMICSDDIWRKVNSN